MSRALILAGGRATRLQPLTDEVPKGLLPLGPTCLLELQIIWLRQAGVTAITLAAGPRSEAIMARFGDGQALGVDLRYLPEPEPLGSGGALRAAAADWAEPFWVLNGDVLMDLDLRAMAERHRESDAWASLALVEVEEVRGLGVVELGPKDEIQRFLEKPDPSAVSSRIVNAGVWRFDPRVRDLPARPGFASVEYDLFPALLRGGRRLQGFRAGAYWVDMGTPDRYLRVAADLVTGRLPAVNGWPRLSSGQHIDPTAQIDGRATIEAPALIGAGSRVEAGVRIMHSVLWDEVTVAVGARVEGSIIAGGARIGPGVVLQNVVVGGRARVRHSPAAGVRIPTDAQV